MVPDGAHGIGWIHSGEPHRLGSGVLGESWGLLTTQEKGDVCLLQQHRGATTHPIPPKGFGGSPNAGLHPSPAVGLLQGLCPTSPISTPLQPPWQGCSHKDQPSSRLLSP